MVSLFRSLDTLDEFDFSAIPAMEIRYARFPVVHNHAGVLGKAHAME